MKTSTDRTLTTHVGSLPRPDSLIDFMIAEDKGESFDEAAFEAVLTEAVKDVVQHQKDLGIDVVSDGEFSKRGFAVYAHERLAGLELQSPMQSLQRSPDADAKATTSILRQRRGLRDDDARRVDEDDASASSSKGGGARSPPVSSGSAQELARYWPLVLLCWLASVVGTIGSAYVLKKI